MSGTSPARVALIDASGDAAQVAAAIARHRGGRVWLLGCSYELSQRLRLQAGDGVQFAEIGRRLTEVTERHADSLVNLDALLGIDPADRVWRASNLAERGPYNSDLLLNVCRAMVMLDILAEGGEHAIVVDDPALLVRLARLARRAYPRVVVTVPLAASAKAAWARLRGGVRAVLARASGGARMLVRMRRVRALRKRHPLRLAELREAHVLVVAWAQKGTFAPGKLVETTEQLGRLPGLLRQAGLKVSFLASPVAWTGAFADIAASTAAADEPVVLLEECIGWADLARAILCPAKVRAARPLVVDGRDLTEILDHELVREAQAWRPALSGLHGVVAAFLARHGVRPQALFYGFENQALEKALIDGCRRHLPQTSLIGVQNALFAANYLCFYPSRGDVAAGLIPDHLVVTGRLAADFFARHGFPPERMLPSALRYEAFLAGARNGARPAGSPIATVLCATAIGYDEALELVVKAGRAVRDRPGLRLVVNFHPVTSEAFRNDLRRAFDMLVGPCQAEVEFSPAGVRELLSGADVVLYNSSGASFEALGAGIPVVFVGRDTIPDFDKVPQSLTRRCWSSEELAAELDRLLALERPARLPARLEEELGRCFAPVDDAQLIRLAEKSLASRGALG